MIRDVWCPGLSSGFHTPTYKYRCRLVCTHTPRTLEPLSVIGAGVMVGCVVPGKKRPCGWTRNNGGSEEGTDLGIGQCNWKHCKSVTWWYGFCSRSGLTAGLMQRVIKASAEVWFSPSMPISPCLGPRGRRLLHLPRKSLYCGRIVWEVRGKMHLICELPMLMGSVGMGVYKIIRCLIMWWRSKPSLSV